MSENASKLGLMGFQKAADTVELYMVDVGNYCDFPNEHWKQIRSTNMFERVNAEIMRRTKVVTVFPSHESHLRISGSFLLEMNEDLVTGYRYLNIAEFLDRQSSEA